MASQSMSAKNITWIPIAVFMVVLLGKLSNPAGAELTIEQHVDGQKVVWDSISMPSSFSSVICCQVSHFGSVCILAQGMKNEALNPYWSKIGFAYRNWLL